MEDMLWRFPHVGEQVFKKLSNKSLIKCMKIARTWENFIKNEIKLLLYVWQRKQNFVSYQMFYNTVRSIGIGGYINFMFLKAMIMHCYL